MATEVGAAYVTLLPSARGFRSNVERAISRDVTAAGVASGRTFGRSFTTSAQSSIRTSSARIGSSLASLSRTAARSMAIVATAAGTAAAGFTTLGLSTAAGLQTAQIGFETLLGSAKRARNFIADLRTFAVATPFETESLIANARALLGVGVQARAVIPTLTALGDATGALGLSQDQFNSILRAYTQIASKGKVQAEELLQLSEAGIPAMQLFSKSLGLTVPELQALMKEGKLTADVALPALLSQLNKDYGGSMSRQFDTLTGVFNNFKETAKLALADGVQPLVPILQNVLPTATAAVGRGIKAASDALAGFIRGVQGAQFDDGKVSFFEKFGAAAKTAFATIRSGVRAALPFLAALWGFITTRLVPAIRDSLTEVGPVIRDAFTSIGNTIKENKGTFRALGTLLTDVLIPALTRASKVTATVLGPAFQVAVGIIKTAVIPAFIILTRTVLTNFDLIISAAAHAFGWVPGIGGKLKNANRSFDKFASGVNDAINSIVNDVYVNVHVQTTSAPDELGFDGTALNPQQAANQNRQNKIADKVAERAKKAGTEAKNSLSDIFGKLGLAAGDSLADGLKDSGKKVKDAATETVNKAVEAAKSALQQARDDLKSYAQSVRDSVASFGSITGIANDNRDVTPNTVAAFLKHQLAAIAAFQKNLKTLARRGISDSLLQQIADAGVEEGGPIAAALAAANKAQFEQIQRTDRRIQKRAGSIGQMTANRVLGDEVASARGKLAEVINITVNNPKAEKASESVPKALKRTTFAAGLGAL